MNKTIITIHEEGGFTNIEVERGIRDIVSTDGAIRREPEAEKGWAVAHILQGQIAELMSKPLSELQQMHLGLLESGQ